VADGLQWILIHEGINHLFHYLDDYIFVASSEEQANSQKSQFISTCPRLGVPLEMPKLEGPATYLTFLGIEVDTISMQLRLPANKLSNLKLTLSHCLCLRIITKRVLQSLTGLLQFATKVIRASCGSYTHCSLLEVTETTSGNRRLPGKIGNQEKYHNIMNPVADPQDLGIHTRLQYGHRKQCSMDIIIAILVTED